MLFAEFRHSLRSLLRMPVFSAICILTLALGIGATTAIFSAIYHTLMKPMPFAGGDRLGYVWMNDSVSGMGISPSASYVDAWRARGRSFAMETYSAGEFTLLGGTGPEAVHGASVSRGLPAMLGVTPVLGRLFTEEEMQLNARNVVVLSESLWRSRFGGARDALGRQIELNDGKKYEIIGVMPNQFAAFEGFDGSGQLWFPIRRDPASQVRDLNPLLKLNEGVSIKTAQAELATIAAGVKLEEKSMPGKWSPHIMTPKDFIDGTTKTGLPILFYAVCGVLLIACANIAGLLLVRLNSRRRELAIRSAMGARRATIVRLLGVEAFILALGGGALGLLVASWLTTAIRAVRPANLNSLDAIRVDGVTLAFAAALSIATAVFFGIAPVIAALRRDLMDGLISGATSGGRVTSSNRVRSIMVAGQIALSLVLLIASLVLVRSVRSLQSRDLGFDQKNVLTMELPMSDEAGYTEASRRAFYDALLPQLRKLPGVTAVSASTGLPNSGGVMFGQVTVRGRQLTEAEQVNFVGFTGVTPEYEQTIGLRLREGRFIAAKETGSPIVINESWAKQLWPTGSAIGHEIRIGEGATNYMRIVGVVADVKGHGPAADGNDPKIYVPFMYSFREGAVAIRTDGRDPSSLVAQVRRIVRANDARIVMRDVSTLESLMRSTIALDRFYMMLLSSFAGLALVLSVIGLYGVISNTVVQRTREIGVRIALGATPRGVQMLVLRQGGMIAALGMALGAVGAWWAVQLLDKTLHEFKPRDPVSFVLGIVALSTGAMLATYIPSRRAVRVDPLDALRSE